MYKNERFCKQVKQCKVKDSNFNIGGTLPEIVTDCSDAETKWL